MCVPLPRNGNGNVAQSESWNDNLCNTTWKHTLLIKESFLYCAQLINKKAFNYRVSKDITWLSGCLAGLCWAGSFIFKCWKNGALDNDNAAPYNIIHVINKPRSQFLQPSKQQNNHGLSNNRTIPTPHLQRGSKHPRHRRKRHGRLRWRAVRNGI